MARQAATRQTTRKSQVRAKASKREEPKAETKAPKVAEQAQPAQPVSVEPSKEQLEKARVESEKALKEFERQGAGDSTLTRYFREMIGHRVLTPQEEIQAAKEVERIDAKIVRERSMLRALINAGNEISGAAFSSDGRTAAEIVDDAERLVFEIAESGSRGRSGFKSLKQILPDAVDRIDVLHQSEGDITGISSGFAEFDKLTAGLQPGDLVIVAGRPSMGKTTLAVNIAENAAIGSKVPTAIFSMEMPGEALTMRMISSLGRVNQQAVRSGKLEDDDWPRLT